MQVLRSGNKTTLVIQDCVRTVAYVVLKHLMKAMVITVCVLKVSEEIIVKYVQVNGRGKYYVLIDWVGGSDRKIFGSVRHERVPNIFPCDPT